MISELTKSINSILYERVTSPLFGAFILSWCAWNWKILYLTMFISSKSITGTKIDFITKNYSQTEYIFTYPIVSTFLLITVVPVFTNAAYWLHIKFYKWRTDKKHQVEMKQLLTLEQSIQIRTEFSNKEKDFEVFITRKNEEIEQLKLQVESLTSTEEIQTTSVVDNEADEQENDEKIKEITSAILKNSSLVEGLEKITERIQNGYPVREKVDSQALAYFTANEIINHKGSGIYEFTAFGKKVNKRFLANRFSMYKH